MRSDERRPFLLTGASGFVGGAIGRALAARGTPFHAVSRRPPRDAGAIRWHRGDLLDPEARARLARIPAATLIHCAWEVEHGAFWASPANAAWQAASRDLVRRFLDAGGGRVIALGSCAEYAATGPWPWNESRPIAPATPYGAAKAALHADLERLAGNRMVWARLFHLYGAGEDPRRLIPSLARALREGRPAEVRAADLIRDYASTDHVAACLLALAEAPAQGAFDIGAGQPRRLGDLAMILADLAGRPDLLRLSHAPAPGDPAFMAPELGRLKGAIAFRPESPEAGLRRLWPQLAQAERR